MITGKSIFSDADRIPAELHGKYNSVAALPSTYAEVAFLGRSNSGKSSLLKALLNCAEPPQISSRPGSTRFLHVYSLKLPQKSGSVALIDFPGFGYAQSAAFFRARFSHMLVNYLNAERPVKALCLVMDCRRHIEDEEREIARIARERRIPLLLCLNKADQLNQSETAKLGERYRNEQAFFEVLLLSAAKRQNLAYLRHFLLSLG